MKRLTVGDNSGLMRDEERCVVRRRTISEIALGETVEIRFKDEFSATPYERYRLDRIYFADKWDEQTGYYTGEFVRERAGRNTTTIEETT